jgi:hypothetical protein
MMRIRHSDTVPMGLAVLAIWLWLAPAAVATEVRTLTATGEYRMGDNDTKTDAKRLALLDAKRQALEQVGTYLEGVTEVKHLSVTRDEIRSYTAGIVEVIEQSTRTTLEGETTMVRVDVTVKVDPAVVTRQLGELRKNELAKEELTRAKAEADRLRKELDDKSRQLAALKGGEAETAVQQRQQVLARADTGGNKRRHRDSGESPVPRRAREIPGDAPGGATAGPRQSLGAFEDGLPVPQRRESRCGDP